MTTNRKNIRAEFHDYLGGECFVTVCTRNKEHYWGKIIRSSSMIPTIESKQNGRDARFVRPNVPGCMNLPATGRTSLPVTGRTSRASLHNILNINIKMGGYFDSEGNAYYYLTDYQETVTGVIDSNEKIVQETGYYPYGEPWLEPEGDNPYLYGGKERVALGGVRYSDFGPRLLSTASGYWGSPDPLLEKTPELSPYINCAANPVRNIDPTGMEVVYSINGDSLGCTKEGFCGSILIYKGTGDFDPSQFSADDLVLDKQIDFYDSMRSDPSSGLTNEAHSKIWTSVVSHYEGMKIFGESFSLAKIEGNKIHFDPGIAKDASWNTEFKLSADFVPIISGNAAFKYEGTVENIASSIIVHEWYSHGVCHVYDGKFNHWNAYFNVICFNPLWRKTTTKYQDLNLNNFAVFYIKESLGLQYRSNFLINKKL